MEPLALEPFGLVRALAADPGRPGDDPRALWRLKLYGYLNRMRSRRRWETATARNLALLWRLGTRRPEVKTIADFRRDHGAAIRQVCRELTRLGQELDRFGGALIAIDGSTLQAVNGQKRTFSGRKLVRWIEALEAKSAAYLQPLDRHEAEDTPRRTPTAEQMQQTREQWHERTPRDPRDQSQRQPRGETPMSLTEPDRRKITRGDSRLVGYHVQGAVDKQYKLSGAHGVTQAVTDPQQRVPLGERARQTLGAETREVVAVMGSYDGAEVQKCAAQGLTVDIPQPQTSANTTLGLCGKERFTSNPAQDGYGCPAGDTLTYRFGPAEQGRKLRSYSTAACGRCAVNAPCPRPKDQRRMTRWAYEDVRERMPQRLANHPEMRLKRKAMVEPPFGTIKRWMDQSDFLLRGQQHVSPAMRGRILAYHITRVVNILGVKTMIEALA